MSYKDFLDVVPTIINFVKELNTSPGRKINAAIILLIGIVLSFPYFQEKFGYCHLIVLSIYIVGLVIFYFFFPDKEANPRVEEDETEISINNNPTRQTDESTEPNNELVNNTTSTNIYNFHLKQVSLKNLNIAPEDKNVKPDIVANSSDSVDSVPNETIESVEGRYLKEMLEDKCKIIQFQEAKISLQNDQINMLCNTLAKISKNKSKTATYTKYDILWGSFVFSVIFLLILEKLYICRQN